MYNYEPIPKIAKVTSQETFVSIESIRLEENESLVVDEVTSLFKITKTVNPRTQMPERISGKKRISSSVRTLSYPLKEITTDELQQLRNSGIPSFVLKQNDRYYHTAIPKDMNFVSSKCKILGDHQCAKTCTHLSAASDKNGGCAKVRGFSIGIERFPWITTGFETFNTKVDSFVVINCEHYEKIPASKTKISPEEYDNIKLSLAQYVWPDLKSLDGLR